MVRKVDGYTHEDSQHPCSRQPPELCDGARLVTQPDGTSRREPGLTSRAFCEPCRSRIITCLEELPPAYFRLQRALGDAPRTGKAVRIPFGPRVLIRSEVDALARVTAVILHGWEARVRGSRLQLAQRAADTTAAESVREACATVGKNIDVLLALQNGWMFRTFTLPPDAPGVAVPHPERCRRCSARITLSAVSGFWYLTVRGAAGPCPAWEHDPAASDGPAPKVIIPDDLLDLIGHREILRKGDGWIQVLTELDGAGAGNEIIDLHWRARRILGETRAQPESFDGIACRSCEAMGLERADPPSDPSLAANHSRCAECRDEMDEKTFHQWADMYASWARGAGIQVCRRCGAGNCGECCWHACACDAAEHPRRRAAALPATYLTAGEHPPNISCRQNHYALDAARIRGIAFSRAGDDASLPGRRPAHHARVRAARRRPAVHDPQVADARLPRRPGPGRARLPASHPRGCPRRRAARPGEWHPGVGDRPAPAPQGRLRPLASSACSPTPSPSACCWPLSHPPTTPT